MRGDIRGGLFMDVTKSLYSVLSAAASKDYV